MWIPGSTDGSVEYAHKVGVNVVQLEIGTPFTAARARNAGFYKLREIAPRLDYVEFIDGDCEVQQGWHQIAQSFLEMHDDVAVICGRRRERYPERSVYNWLCDQEWDGPVGSVRACGGDAMIRVAALVAVGGYRSNLIAGEEPELCIRLRATGWRIWRLSAEMTIHDAAMTQFSQWWRRSTRAGYAFAEGSHLYGATTERHWVWESRRAWLWGIWLPLCCLVLGLTFEPWGWLALLLYPLQIFRQVLRNSGPVRRRVTLAAFQMLGRFPESWGQIKLQRDCMFGRQGNLIDYK